jgi:coniferyl-aldehyde dehydrogenase
VDIAATTPISELAPTLQLLRKAWLRQRPDYRQRRDDLQRLHDILALRVIIWDSSVAAMDGQRLRPPASGSTMVEVRAGDQSGGASAKV